MQQIQKVSWNSEPWSLGCRVFREKRGEEEVKSSTLNEIEIKMNLMLC